MRREVSESRGGWLERWAARWLPGWLRERPLWLVAVGVAIVVAAALPDAAYAQVEDLGEVGEQLGSQSEGMAEGARLLGGLVGFVMVLVGVGLFTRRRQDSLALPIALFAAGVTLMSAVTLVEIGSSTIFESDESREAIRDLDLD